MKHLLLLLTIFTLSTSAFSQIRKIEIVHTDKMVGDKNVRKLYGNVVFKHKDALMYCDSAYFYAKDNRFEAYNNVKIVDKKVIITADSLNFESKNSLAQLRGNVIFNDENTKLTTRFMDYNSKERIGFYYNNGTIVDSDNTLTSQRGIYYANSHEVYFKKNVILINKDYRIETDTLKYNTQSEIAFFFGPSNIISEQNLLYTENGWYNTQTDVAQFYKNSYIQSDAQFVYGDDLHYERNINQGIAKGNVLIKDTTEKISLFGSFAFYDGKNEFSYVTKDILMIQELDSDSLFLHADSIYLETFYLQDSIDSTKYNLLKAYHKVRFFKSDIQGTCDSLVYNSKDSTIVLKSAPIIWSDQNQITGFDITLQLNNNKLSRIYIPSESFVVSQDSETQYNQMKGKSLIGYVKNNELYKIDIKQNGETIYYLRDGNDMIGVNKAVCDSITLHIKKSQADQIVFKSKPTGTLYPPNQLTKDAQVLTNFRWLDYIRPKNRDDLYEWRD